MITITVCEKDNNSVDGEILRSPGSNLSFVSMLCSCCTPGRSRSIARRTTDAITLAVAEVLADDEIASRAGVLQKVDPRVKLATLAMLAITASLVHSPLLLALLYGTGVALGAASHVGVGSLVRRVWLSAGIFSTIIAIPATTSFVTGGPVLLVLGPIVITRPGALGAMTLILRVVASANFAFLIALTTRWPDILRGLSALKIPDIFVATLGMAQRYVISLLKTVQQMHLAKESRTIARVSTAQERRWVTGRMAFVVKKSINMGNDVYDAMLSRGYSGSVRALSPLKATKIDLLWLGSAIFFCAMLLLANYRMVPR